MAYRILEMDKAQCRAALALWQDAFEQGETDLIPPGEPDAFFDAVMGYTAVCGQAVAGFALGAAVGERAALTMVLVQKACRRQGIGSALVRRLLAAWRAQGVTRVVQSWQAPVPVRVLVHRPLAHDHNNVPGVPTDSPGYPFLLALGFAHTKTEVMMHRALAGYALPENHGERAAVLEREGITVGLYDPARPVDVAQMCRSLNSDHWLGILSHEIAKEAPRPIPCAVKDGRMIGFSGPCDREASGRGWFAGVGVDPAYQGRGLATLIFELLLHTFVRLGCTHVTLFTGSDNPAQRIYRRAGLTVGKEAAVMEKRLCEI